MAKDGNHMIDCYEGEDFFYESKPSVGDIVIKKSNSSMWQVTVIQDNWITLEPHHEYDEVKLTLEELESDYDC